MWIRFKAGGRETIMEFDKVSAYKDEIAIVTLRETIRLKFTSTSEAESCMYNNIYRGIYEGCRIIDISNKEIIGLTHRE